MPLITKNAVVITNDVDKYPFRLHCDDRKGYIRMFKNHQSRTITNRDVPITTSEKWDFHNQRTGYYEEGQGPFIGSYILKSRHPITYDKWMHFIMYRFIELRNKERDNDN